jgi:TRAP-type mannitol/chloroaromatic compound transport system permease small subunit
MTLGAGDILSAAAAGVLFPLMLLPLAAYATRRSGALGSLRWAAYVAVVAGAGYAFAIVAPRLDFTPDTQRLAVAATLFGALTLLVACAGGPRRATEALAGPLGAIARGAGRAAMWLLLAMAFVQFGVVILRYVFGVNSILMQESITYMHGAVFLLAAGYALLTDDHVRVDILYRSAAPRRKALIDFLGTYLFLFPACLVILATAGDYVAEAWRVREGSAEQSGIRGVYLLKSLIPIFAVLLAMAGFANAARAGAFLRDGR